MSSPPVAHLILDRDGVLNREVAGRWVGSVDDWEWEHGALDGLELLARAGVAVSVVTNQSGIGRGTVPASSVDDVHRWLAAELAAMGVRLGGIHVCPHAPDDGCACRKPSPVLVERAVVCSGIPASATLLVGDAARDLDAGWAAGTRVGLVATGKGSATALDHPEVTCWPDLTAVARSVLGQVTT